MSSADVILDVSACSKWLGLQTQAAQTSLALQTKEWVHDEQRLPQLSAKCKRFKEAIQRDPTFFPACAEHFRDIAQMEEKLVTLMKRDSEMEKESYSEILFFKPLFQPLNFIPFILSIWSFIRVYLLPGLSLLLPILTLIAPYLILTFVFRIPITFQNYMNLLQAMLSGQIEAIMNPETVKVTQGFSPASFIKQIGVVAVTLIQGILQPYWSYQHLNSIDNIILDHGQLVLRFQQRYHALEELLAAHGFTFFKCPLPPLMNERDATARIILESAYFKMALKYVGGLEVILCLANQKEVQPVKWVRSAQPVFRIKNTFDFQVSEETRTTLSADCSTKQHTLLTGPNKGGKSTVLRALSVSALFAHTYGCAIGHLTATPFQHIYVCLKPDDLPGSKSRFEREIEFTADTLTHSERTLVFIDELYHSTNPPDALRSCQIYCEQLWKKQNVVSVISTHLFALVEEANSSIQRLCCPATKNESGIQFHYRLEEGICKVSSVDTLLQNNGLMPPRQTAG